MSLSTSIRAGVAFAWRDLRVVLLDYKVLILAIAIGVAAVTGVRALTDSFLTGLQRDGRTLIGGDISFSRAQEPPSADDMRFFDAHGTVSVFATTRAMVLKDGGLSALADIKAVEPTFPLVGTVKTTPMVLPAQLDADGGRRGALLDPRAACAPAAQDRR